MVDQCDGCNFYRTPQPDIGECRINDPSTTNRWPNVLPTDWCGRFEPIGTDGTNLRLNGNQTLTTTALVFLVDNGGDLTFTAVAIMGIQVTNLANSPEAVMFYDGNDNTKLLTSIGLIAMGSGQMSFRANSLVALSGSVYASLQSSASAGVVVTVQGYKSRGSIIE